MTVPKLLFASCLSFLLAAVLVLSPSEAQAKRKKKANVEAQIADDSGTKKRKNKKRKAKAVDAQQDDDVPEKKTKKTASNDATAKPKAVSDTELAEIYKAIVQGKSRAALDKTEALLVKAPNYKLLSLLRADLLTIRAQRPAALPPLTAAQQQRVSELQQEAWLRLNSQATHNKAMVPTMMPKPLWRLADNEPYAIVVDSKLSRLYVYKNVPNAAPQLVNDYYVTQGQQGIFKVKEGDNRTPIGAYFIDGAIKQKLPDLYGYGALNIDYPNAWDKRLGRTGYGIWLHGTPSATYARAPYASNGCVVLANPDMEAIFQLPSSGAMPIVVVDKLEFVESNKVDAERKSLLDALEQWRKDWEALNIKNYGSHYSKAFKVDDYDRDRWLARKQDIFTQQAKASITLSNVAALEYPSEAGMVITRFDQAYQAGASQSSVRKQLYWKKEANAWKIVLENTL